MLVLAAGCKTPGNEIGNLLNERLTDTFSKNESLDIFFITNRKINPDAAEFCSNNYLGVDISTKLQSGKCRVNVPADHEIGSIDSSANGSTDKFFKLISNAFYDEDKLLAEIKNDSFPEIILFVHGFNVNFEEAVTRAAQIKYDLKFPGKIVIFTWPAGSDPDSLLGKFLVNVTYRNNLANAVKSRVPFTKFLRDLKSTGKTVHLIVHSMGHQVVLPSIAKVKNDGPVINELILNAPDFSIRDFNEIRSDIKSSAKRVTLYCSPGDNALFASSQINENDRLGSCANFNGIDVINVNPIDNPVIGLGHGYYSSRPILTDVFQLILGVNADKRLFIRKSETPAKEDYLLRK